MPLFKAFAYSPLACDDGHKPKSLYSLLTIINDMVEITDQIDLDQILAIALVRPMIKSLINRGVYCILDINNPQRLRKYLRLLRDSEVIGEWAYSAGVLGKKVDRRIHPLKEAKFLDEHGYEFSNPSFHYHTRQEILDRIKELE